VSGRKVNAGLPRLAQPEAERDGELTDFQRGVSKPGRLSLVGTMLQDSTDAKLRARYQERVIATPIT
jgi:hypothetical protein